MDAPYWRNSYLSLWPYGCRFRPFHKERTPSFYVSPDRQLAYCFGCRKGGDHFKFLQEMEGLDFRAALEMLAEKITLRWVQDWAPKSCELSLK